MRYQKLIRGALLSSWLVSVSATAFAHNTSDNDTPSLFGSPATLERLGPIRDQFLALSKTNTLVYQRDDFVSGSENMDLRIFDRLNLDPDGYIPDDEALARIKKFLKPFEDILPYSIDDIGHNAHSITTESLIKFNAAIARNAVARSSIDEKTGKRLCEVIAPPFTDTAENFFIKSIDFPDALSVPSVRHIDYDDIFFLVMLHEAVHCSQTNNASSTLAFSLNTLGMETEADKFALRAMKEYIHGKPAAYYQDLADLNRAVRVIAPFRLGIHTFSKDEFDVHVTHVFDPGDDPGFEYDTSDIALSIRLINTSLNMTAGFLFEGWFASPDEQSALANASSIQRNIKNIGKNYSLQETVEHIESGQHITREQPALQYGVIKAMRDIVADHSNRTGAQESTLERKTTVLSVRMMENYLGAIEKYVPAVAGDSVVKDVYDKVKAQGGALYDVMPLSRFLKLRKAARRAIKNAPAATESRQMLEYFENLPSRRTRSLIMP